MRALPLALGLCVTLLTATAQADYLEIRRNAWLKKTATSDGAEVEKLGPGTLVALASDTQENAYYQVKTRAGVPGFVYRTLVRRHPGDLPALPAPPPGAHDHGTPGGTPTTPPAGGVTSSNLPPLAAGQMRAHLINVGQGASTLFEFTCGAVLIDVGGEMSTGFDSGHAIRGYLDRFFTRRADLNNTLDLVVLTHPHKDHTDNAQLVGERYTVRNVATNGLTSGLGYPMQKWLRDHAPAGHLETVTASGIPAGGRTNAIIDPVQCTDEDPKLTVLWGSLSQKPSDWSPSDFAEENNHSVAVRIDFGHASFLVTGDLEIDGIRSLLTKHNGTPALDVDVWQVSHHGADNGTTPALLTALTPLIALIGTGKDNRHDDWTAWQYGHPRKRIIDLLAPAVAQSRPPESVRVALGTENFQSETLNKAIYATGWDGSVVVTADRNGGYEVVTSP